MSASGSTNSDAFMAVLSFMNQANPGSGAAFLNALLAKSMPKGDIGNQGQPVSIKKEEPVVDPQITAPQLKPPSDNSKICRKRPAAIEELVVKKKERLSRMTSSEEGTPTTCQSPDDDSGCCTSDSPISEDLSPQETKVCPETLFLPTIPLRANIHPDMIFSAVPGRLSLLANNSKYKVTVGELRRRIEGPETFNFSLTSAFLRRAKMPSKSIQLNAELFAVGLIVPRGRRLRIPGTLFSGLTEAEAQHFANDFRRISTEFFPAKTLGKNALESHISRCTEVQSATGPQIDSRSVAVNRLFQLQRGREIASEFMTAIGAETTPKLCPDLQFALSNYSMLTHGFGAPGLLVGVKMFVDFLDAQIEALVPPSPNS